MTLLTISTIAITFAWILAQEWRELTKSNRYVCKLDEAKANERKVGA